MKIVGLFFLLSLAAPSVERCLACGWKERRGVDAGIEGTPWEGCLIGEGWGMPINLGPLVNTEGPDCRPSVTLSGDTLFFEAEREGGFGGIDVWMSVWNGTEWGEPVNLGENVNSPYQESKPYIAPDGRTLYFDSNRPGGYGELDIYVTTLGDSGWTPAEPLDSTVNSPFRDSAPALSFDGRKLYFVSDRPGGYGNYDLWVSTREGDRWTEPINLGPRINTSSVDWFALETPDGTRLYITQERPGGYGGVDLWYCERDGPGWSLPVNAGLPLNYYVQCSPSMTADGRKLFFGGGRMNEGYGDLDLWMSVYQEWPVDTLYLEG